MILVCCNINFILMTTFLIQSYGIILFDLYIVRLYSPWGLSCLVAVLIVVVLGVKINDFTGAFLVTIIVLSQTKIL